MRPHVVIVTDRFTRLYWLVIVGSAVFLAGLLGIGIVYEILSVGWVIHVR